MSDSEPVELVAALINHNGANATFGVGASIDRWNGRGWIRHRQVVMCLDHWNCSGEPQRLGEDVGVPSVGLQAGLESPGPPERFTTKGLGRGWYRISQEANEGMVAGAILQITNDAAPVAPLGLDDKPAISVAPVLVPPTGATVQLSPLVPPRNGMLTRVDIERAIADLGETATIERWDGRNWQPVIDVPLQRSTDPLARRAELPRLTEGDYRLVRVGPNGAHTGRFWVTAST